MVAFAFSHLHHTTRITRHVFKGMHRSPFNMQLPAVRYLALPQYIVYTYTFPTITRSQHVKP